MGIREARSSVYQFEELASQWSIMFKKTITERDILRIALAEGLNVYVLSTGLRSVMLRSRGSVLAGKPPIAVPAYMDEQFIKLSDSQIRFLLSRDTITISLLWLNVCGSMNIR